METQIEINQHNQDSLELSKAAFFRNGGKVEVIETPQFYVPLPKRKEPKLCAAEIRLRELAEKIREIAPSMSRMEVSKAVGISYERAGDICRKFGIRTRQAVGNKSNSHIAVRYDASADPAMAEQIKSLLSQGNSKTKTAKIIGIGSERLNRIIDKYKIDRKRK